MCASWALSQYRRSLKERDAARDWKLADALAQAAVRTEFSSASNLRATVYAIEKLASGALTDATEATESAILPVVPDLRQLRERLNQMEADAGL